MATAVMNGEAAQRRSRLPDHLPALSGWTLRTYQALWIVAAILAVASSTFVAFRWELKDQAVALATYDAGLLPGGTYAEGARVMPFSREAHAAGIGNDLIVRVDGVPAPSDADRVAPLLSGPDGSRVTLTLRGADGRDRDVVLTRDSHYLPNAYAGAGLNWRLRRWIEFAINLTANLLAVLAATLLFMRRSRDPVAALLSFGIILSSVTLVQLGGNSMKLLAWALWSVSAPMIFMGVLFFPDGRLTPRWWPFGAAAIAAAGLFNLVAYWALPLRTVTPFVALAALGISVAAVITRYRTADPGVTRQQIKFAMFGFVACIVFDMLSIGFDQGVLQASDEGLRAWLILFRSLANSGTVIAFVWGLLVALLRFRLYDAETAIGRSAAYGILTIGFVGLFAGAEKLSEIIGERYFEHSVGIAAGAVGAAVAAVCIVPLHDRVHRWAERRFQKPLVRLREGLPEWLADLRDTASVQQIAQAVTKRVAAGVRSTREVVLVRENGVLAVVDAHSAADAALTGWQTAWREPAGNHVLECDRKDSLFPMRVRLCIETTDEPETIGWLLLGPRPDGTLFGKDEREALAHVAGAIARAIHIAQLREEREQRAEARLSGLEAMIARMIGGLPGGKAATV